MAYRILSWFLSLVARVFFRQVEVVGLEHVPADGAVIFVGNHPNSLIDPILIITTCGRPVHFAAKDTLFKNALLRSVLYGLGAVPIARRADHAASAAGVDNDAAFSAMFEVLGRGQTIGIFPEGLSHDESQLSKLKTGAARLALGAAARGAPKLTIVPCGLTFVHPKRFRSRVLVQYGEPIAIDEDWRTKNATDGVAAVRELTAVIDRDLRALTINSPDWDTVRALDTVRRLYQPADIGIEARVELARRFNAHYPSVKDDARVIAVIARASSYQQHLDELGISDRELARDLSSFEITRQLTRYFALVLFWTPMTVPGAPLHLPTVLFARFAGSKLTPRKDVVATTKIVTGILLVLLAYGTTIAYLGWHFRLRWAIAAAVILPLSGYATLCVIDRIVLFRRGLGALRRRLQFRVEVKRLRRERAELSADIIATVNAMKPDSLELLVPQVPAQ